MTQMTDIFQISGQAPIANISVIFLVEDEIWHIGYMWYVKFSQHGTYDISGRLSTAYICGIPGSLNATFFKFQVYLRLYKITTLTSINISIISHTLPF